MIAKFNTKQFTFYFEKFTDKFWLENLFRARIFDKSPVINSNDNFIEIDTDYISTEYTEKFNSICELCKYAGLTGYEIDFLAVYYASISVNLHKTFINSDVKYQRELYSVFVDMVKEENGAFKELDFNIHIQKQEIKNERFANDIKTKIFDLVATNFEWRKFNELTTDEKIQLIEKVNQYLEDTKPGSGQPEKPLKRKQFIYAIEKYIVETIPTDKFESGRKRHLFIWKLTNLYGIIPDPDKPELLNYYIKTIENLLPKNTPKNA